MNEGNGSHGISAAARHVAEHASAITRLEFELATLELKDRAVSLGLGLGLTVAAAAFGLLALIFGLATVAAAIALSLPVWLSLLIVTGALLLLAGIAAAIGVSKMRGKTRPVPDKAIREAKLTSDALKR